MAKDKCRVDCERERARSARRQSAGLPVARERVQNKLLDSFSYVYSSTNDSRKILLNFLLLKISQILSQRAVKREKVEGGTRS